MGKRFREAIALGASFLSSADALSGQVGKKQEIAVKGAEKAGARKLETKINAEIAEILKEIEARKKLKSVPNLKRNYELSPENVQGLIDSQYNEIAGIILKLFLDKPKNEHKKIATDNGVTFNLIDLCIKAQDNNKALGQDAKVRLGLMQLKADLFLEAGPKGPPNIFK